MPLDDLDGDLLAADHELEDALAENLFEPGEVDVLKWMEAAPSAEEAQGANRVTVGVR